MNDLLGGKAFPLVLAGLCGAFLLPFAAKHFFHIYADPIGNWCNVAASVLILVQLRDWRPGALLQRIDRWAGDLSYPVYLLHWQSGAIASHLLFHHPVRGGSVAGLAAFALILPIVLLLSMPQILLVDPVVGRYRDAVRSRGVLRAARTPPLPS